MSGKGNLTFRNRNEFEFLVSCVRDVLNGEGRGQARFHAEVDWNAFTCLAVRHRVVPQIHHLLSQGVPDSVPHSVREQFADLNAEIVAHNLTLTAELVRIARVFQRRSIPLLAFKGPTLASELYGELHQRQFVDLDLMVRPNDLPAAIELFHELGYQACSVDLGGMSPSQLRRVVIDSKSYELVRSEPPHQYHVDLHWRLSNDDTFFTNVPESLFDDATETTISGQPILTMPTRQLVSYLAFHGGNHRWMRLSWLCDLAHAMRRIPQERWPDLLDEAARCNAERYLIGGLLLLERLQFVNELSDTISPVQRRRLSRLVTRMEEVLSADDAAPLLNVLADGYWRYQFSGRVRPLANSLLRFVRPKQRDFLYEGRVRPYLSRWQYIATKTVTSILPRGDRDV
jgi:hypothetical protein